MTEGRRLRWLAALLLAMATLASWQSDRLQAEVDFEGRSGRLLQNLKLQLRRLQSPMLEGSVGAPTEQVLWIERQGTEVLVTRVLPELPRPGFQVGDALSQDAHLSRLVERCDRRGQTVGSEPLRWLGTGFAVLWLSPLPDGRLLGQVVPASSLVSPELDPVHPEAISLVDVTEGVTGRVLFENPPQGTHDSWLREETTWPVGGRIWSLTLGGAAPPLGALTTLYALLTVLMTAWAMAGLFDRGPEQALVAQLWSEVGQLGPNTCSRLVRLAVEASHVTQVSLWLLDESSATCRLRFDRRTQRETGGQRVARAACVKFLRLLEEETLVASRRPLEDPRLEELRSLQLESAGTRSLMAVLLRLGPDVLGLLSFEDCERERAWTPAEQRLGRSVAGLISLALEREQKVLESGDGSLGRRRRDLSRRHTRVSFFELDPAGGRLSLDRNFVTSLGLRPEVATDFEGFCRSLERLDRERFELALGRLLPGQQVELRLRMRTLSGRRVCVQLDATRQAEGRLLGSLRDLSELEQWLELAGGPVFRLGRGGVLEPLTRRAARLLQGGTGLLGDRAQLARALRRLRRRGRWKGALQLTLGDRQRSGVVRLVRGGQGEVLVRPFREPAAPVPPVARVGRHVLVVDDNRAVLTTIGMVLRAQKYTVHLVSDGEAARAILAAHPVELLLVDRNLSGQSGWELAEHLRLAYPGLRVLRMSGGPDAELSKPFTPDLLLARLDEAFAR